MQSVPSPILRVATRGDVPGIQRVRRSVRENVLSSRSSISDDEVFDFIESFGRGWVIVDGGNEVLAFAFGDVRDRNIWALFVDPSQEGRGYGRMLHDEMVAWLWPWGSLACGSAPIPALEPRDSIGVPAG